MNYFLCKIKQLSQYASYAMKEAVPQVGNLCFKKHFRNTLREWFTLPNQ